MIRRHLAWRAIGLCIAVAFALLPLTVEAKSKLHVQVILPAQAINYINETIVPEFEALYDVEVTIETVGWGNRFEKVIVGTAAGVPPDIFMSGAEHVQELVAAGMVYPLDRELNAWDEHDDFFPVTFGSSTWEGQRYGVPVYTGPRTWWYRESVFHEHGLDPDAPPRSWNELLDYAKRLSRTEDNRVVREGIDVSRFALGGHFATIQDFIAYLWQNGGDLVDPESYLPLFYSQEGIETTQFLLDLKNAVLPPGYSMGLATGNGSAFLRGLTGISLAGGWHASEVMRLDPDLAHDYRAIIPVPGKVEHVSPIFSDWLSIHPHSPNKELAWKFIQAITSAQSLIDINISVGTLSPRISTVQDFVEAIPPVYYLYETIPYARPFPVFPKSQELIEAFHSQYSQIITGNKGINTGLEEAARLWEILLKNQ